MKIKLQYSDKKIPIEINESVDILNPKKIDIESEKKVIIDGFNNPLSKESFEEYIKNKDKLLIIVNDATRPTPTSKIIKYMDEFIEKINDLCFIVACGSHRDPTIDELKFIFGEKYGKYKDRIIFHDAEDKKNMKKIGKTKRGTEILFNKKIFEYKNVIAINSVEPHYFAGYTGGRKSFLPGVASYDTIEHNHKFALEKNACGLKLDGNPVHEDMNEGVSFLKDLDIFSIQVVLTADSELYKITTGDLYISFKKAVEYANKVFCSPIKNKGNIVITVAPPPMDIDLYQSQKALENGKLALEKNGIIILISFCPKGIGPEKFYNLLSSENTSEKVLKTIEKGYKLGYHKAAKIADLDTWADIWAVTNIDENKIKKAFMKPYNDVQKAVDDAIIKTKYKGLKPKIILLPYGSLTVPLIC